MLNRIIPTNCLIKKHDGNGNEKIIFVDPSVTSKHVPHVPVWKVISHTWYQAKRFHDEQFVITSDKCIT